MDIDIESLAQQTGLPVEFLKFLYEFSKGDIETILKIIKSLEKDLVIIKGKFIAGLNSGVFLIFLNTKTENIEGIIAVSSLQKDLSSTDLSISWETLLTELNIGLSREQESLKNFSEILSQYLQQNQFVKFFKDIREKFPEKNLEVANLKRFFTKAIMDIFGEEKAITKLEVEEENLFKFYKFLKDIGIALGNLGIIQTGVKEKGEEGKKDTEEEVIVLLVEPILSPISGKPGKDIVEGDKVYVRLQSLDNVSFSIGRLIGAVDEVGNFKPTIGEVVKKENLSEGKVGILLKLAPGIFAKFFVDEEVKVKIAKEEDARQVVKLPETTEFLEEKEEIKGSSIGIIRVILIATIALLGIALVVYIILSLI